VITRIGSDKAQAYVRSLPHSKGVPLAKTVPMADADGAPPRARAPPAD
jgi:hypothetical protein